MLGDYHDAIGQVRVIDVELEVGAGWRDSLPALCMHAKP